jgi:hypothetical protein
VLQAERRCQLPGCPNPVSGKRTYCTTEHRQAAFRARDRLAEVPVEVTPGVWSLRCRFHGERIGPWTSCPDCGLRRTQRKLPSLLECPVCGCWWPADTCPRCGLPTR